MSKRYIDILPKIEQYESIPYAGDLCCQDCGEGNFENYGEPGYDSHAPIAVGWCDTPYGFMGVFECPICHNKFRFHSTIGTWIANLDEFNHYLYYKARNCANWEELKEKLGE